MNSCLEDLSTNKVLHEREGGQMAGKADKLGGITQSLQLLLLGLGKIQAGDGNALNQLMDFIEENADQILQARPLLESEGLSKLINQFVPNVNEKELRRAVTRLLDLAEQTAKKKYR